jgi:hypothetical protein
MQMGVSCFLPKKFGGLGRDASCLYVDTEGSFISSRYREIASAAVAQVVKVTHQQQWTAQWSPAEVEEMRSETSSFSVERVLEGTKVMRLTQLTDLLALVQGLRSIVDTSGVKLVIIDSIAFPFRSAASKHDARQMSAMLFHCGQLLQSVCRESRVGLMVTNHMTTRMHGDDAATRVSELVPALGDHWAHCVSTRIVLRAPSVSQVQSTEEGTSQLRIASLKKSPSEVTGECRFVVCQSGVRNAPSGPT